MTSGINRKPPPRVRQSRKDSCWAATLESWSKTDSRIPTVMEAQMIADYGEGPTAGITPTLKIPVIAERFGLKAGGFHGRDLDEYLTEYLRFSHVFCGYKRDQTFHHSVLIYRLSGQNSTHVSYMDPDGGYHRWQTLDWFSANGPLVLMRKL